MASPDSSQEVTAPDKVTLLTSCQHPGFPSSTRYFRSACHSSPMESTSGMDEFQYTSRGQILRSTSCSIHSPKRALLPEATEVTHSSAVTSTWILHTRCHDGDHFPFLLMDLNTADTLSSPLVPFGDPSGMPSPTPPSSN